MKRLSSLSSFIHKRQAKLKKNYSNPTCKESQNTTCLINCPNEIIFNIFSFLDLSDLANFALTCRYCRMLIEQYTSSYSCLQLRQFKYPHISTVAKGGPDLKNRLLYYTKVGRLFRSLHILFPLQFRITMLTDILLKHLCSDHYCNKKFTTQTSLKNTNQDSDSRHSEFAHCSVGKLHCPSLFLFGCFLRAFLLGSTNHEYQRVFHSLVHCCFRQNFWLRLTNLICKQPGEYPNEEITVRLFLRRIFLDPLGLPTYFSHHWGETNLIKTNVCTTIGSAQFSGGSFIHSNLDLNLQPSTNCQNSQLADSSESSFASAINFPGSSHSGQCVSKQEATWLVVTPLSNILRSYPFVNQARLLFILYGPARKGQLMWQIMCENTAADMRQLSACFGELGFILNSMFASGQWSAGDIIAISDELTAIPNGWLAENIACLLHAAGPQLASLSITSKATKAKISELAVILTSLCLVQVKMKSNLSGLLSLVGEAVNSTPIGHRQNFLDSLAHAFRGIIVDLYETDELNDRIEDFSTILKAQSYFFRALLARVYEE